MLNHSFNKLLVLCLVTVLTGCSGIQTFQSSLRAGDTAAVAAGWKHNFSRNNVMVRITSSTGNIIEYYPGNPAIRAIINLYPDPLSSMIISEATNQDITPYASSYSLGTSFITSGDKDWWQTTVFVDLPNNLPTGLTSVEVVNSQGDSATSTVNIIEGIGQAEEFDVDQNGPLTTYQFAALERVQHYVISFTSNEIPHAIQIELSHNPDVDNGGVGKVYVSNPRGDLKSITWNDTGTNLHVVLSPTQLQSVDDMHDFKFYVSGGISNLALNNIVAVDINGNELSGVVVGINSEN